MDALQRAIQEAFDSCGESKKANKAYLEFIKANFIIPIQIHSDAEKPEVLFLQEGEHTFLPVFTSEEHLSQWAGEISDKIKVLRLSGVDLLKGIGDNITLCLNIGAPSYKEFNPAETARMRSIILKFFKN
jgi:hypothetical protein